MQTVRPEHADGDRRVRPLAARSLASPSGWHPLRLHRPLGRLGLFLVACGLMLFPACSDSGPASPKEPEEPIPAKVIHVFPGSISLLPGDQYIFDARFQESPEQPVRWTVTGGSVTANGDSATYTAPVQPGTYTLTVTGVTDASAKGTATIVVAAPPTGVPTGPSGAELIDQALAAGQLDVSTATRYKAYWAFQDSRLPARFTGAPGSGATTHPPREIFDPPPGVSPAALAELRSYSLPPSDPDSWFQIRWRAENGGTPGTGADIAADRAAEGEDGISADLVDGAFQLLGFDPVTPASRRLRVWWDRRRPGDKAIAEKLAADLDAAWTLLAASLTHQPRPAYSRPAMDVYLLGLGVDGFVAVTAAEATTPGAASCPSRGSYMTFNRDLVARFQGTGTPTHEMLHAFIDAIPKAASCESYAWFHEATATWVETLINPSRLIEPASIRTRRLREYRNDLPGVPLHEQRGGETLDGYGAYPFFVFLDREFGTSQVFGAINQTAQGNPIVAIDAATGGNFPSRFQDFAVEAWGEAPFNRLGPWLGSEVPHRNEVSLDLEGEESGLWRDDPPAERSYLYYQFDAAGAEDPPARVRILNPFSADARANSGGTLGAHLLYRKAGQSWRYEDISTRSGKSFCLDDPEEEYDHFGLIITNALGRSEPYESPLAMAWDSCEYSPYWRITEFSDLDNLLNDEDLEGSGEAFEMLQRLANTPRSGVFAVRESEEDDGATSWLELRVRKSGIWSDDDCCPLPAAASNEFVQPLGSDPPVPQNVGPFFAEWSSDFWTQSTEDLDTGEMSARQALGHTTYRIKDGGSQRGPTGGFQLSATRDGFVMTGELRMLIWWWDEESGEVEDAPEAFRFSFKASRWADQ